jgi:hypothetical protein
LGEVAVATGAAQALLGERGLASLDHAGADAGPEAAEEQDQATGDERDGGLLLLRP